VRGITPFPQEEEKKVRHQPRRLARAREAREEAGILASQPLYVLASLGSIP
jgi:hypothetical protein